MVVVPVVLMQYFWFTCWFLRWGRGLVCFSLSEMKLQDILSSLMMDDTYKGRGKYHSEVTAQPVRID